VKLSCAKHDLFFFKTEDQLYIQTPENISGKKEQKDKIIGEREKKETKSKKFLTLPPPLSTLSHSLSPPSPSSLSLSRPLEDRDKTTRPLCTPTGRWTGGLPPLHTNHSPPRGSSDRRPWRSAARRRLAPLPVPPGTAPPPTGCRTDPRARGERRSAGRPDAWSGGLCSAHAHGAGSKGARGGGGGSLGARGRREREVRSPRFLDLSAAGFSARHLAVEWSVECRRRSARAGFGRVHLLLPVSNHFVLASSMGFFPVVVRVGLVFPNQIQTFRPSSPRNQWWIRLLHHCALGPNPFIHYPWSC
jgi:hypothetical protein